MIIDVLLHTGLVFLVALMVPGPDFMIVSQTSISRGFKAGVASSVGVALGCLFYAGLSLWGLDVVLSEAGWMANGLRVLGGAYLLYLAYQVWRGAGQPIALPETGMAKSDEAHFWLKACWKGLLTNLTNPKAIAFFSSIFAMALTPETSNSQKIMLLALVLVLPVVWFSLVSFVMSRPQFRAGYARLKKGADRVAALVMGGFGLKLILSPIK